MEDALGYKGKRVVVTGSASGMGEAAAQILVDLGAEAHFTHRSTSPEEFVTLSYVCYFCVSS